MIGFWLGENIAENFNLLMPGGNKKVTLKGRIKGLISRKIRRENLGENVLLFEKGR